MRALSREFPLVEWAVLYSAERAGREGRFPSLAWLERFAVNAQRAQLGIALHLCGSAIRTALGAMASPPGERTEQARELLALCAKYGRVQINVLGKRADAELYLRFGRELGRSEARTQVILPYYPAHADLAEVLAQSPDFDILCDSSDELSELNERGATWPQLSTEAFTRLGFANGPGHCGIGEMLDDIAEAYPDRAFWVYLESELLNEKSQFSLARCQLVLLRTRDWEESFSPKTSP